MEKINIKLENFEGPFDLLLKLIDKNKLDIYDIHISKLTNDYLDYINSSDFSDMEHTSQFILMASILLEIKSKMLLPKEKNENDEEIDPREELIARLVEYKKYKMIASELSSIDVFIDKVAFKGADKNALNMLMVKDEPTIDDLLDGVSLDKLYNTFLDVIKRKELKIDKVRANFSSVTRSLYNITDKIDYIKDLLSLNSTISFSSIFFDTNSKIEAVVTFLAMLELMKSRQIVVSQQNIFDEITISKGVIIDE